MVVAMVIIMRYPGLFWLLYLAAFTALCIWLVWWFIH
jgi:hypothetical protein